MSIADLPQPVADVLFLLLGLVVGSFLNVLALRSLSGESFLFPASHCPSCKHPLAPSDNIPVLSYLLLRGRCRFCRCPISWQYPAVELFTGLTFVAIERVFLFGHIGIPAGETYNMWDLSGPPLFTVMAAGLRSQLTNELPFEVKMALGALLAFFACTLIAVTVTDFREKLIPHEITYPSMLLGILFSTVVRHDLPGAMAGIGASYILFDFLAFYGLKLYMFMHGVEEEQGRSRSRPVLRRRLRPGQRRSLRAGRFSRLRWRLDLSDRSYAAASAEAEESLEVMGGGDAVLSAVMAAYLGWQLLAVALVIGFLVGTLMGLSLLIAEMKKAKLLHKCTAKSLQWAAGVAVVFGAGGLLMDGLLNSQDSQMHSNIALPLSVLGAVGGALIGVVSVGTRVSRPYPFGPALAAGGFIAMFLLPRWLAFH